MGFPYFGVLVHMLLLRRHLAQTAATTVRHSYRWVGKGELRCCAQALLMCIRKRMLFRCCFERLHLWCGLGQSSAIAVPRRLTFVCSQVALENTMWLLSASEELTALVSSVVLELSGILVVASDVAPEHISELAARCPQCFDMRSCCPRGEERQTCMLMRGRQNTSFDHLDMFAVTEDMGTRGPPRAASAVARVRIRLLSEVVPVGEARAFSRHDTLVSLIGTSCAGVGSRWPVQTTLARLPQQRGLPVSEDGERLTFAMYVDDILHWGDTAAMQWA